jgi:hypothetical protein
MAMKKSSKRFEIMTKYGIAKRGFGKALRQSFKCRWSI